MSRSMACVPPNERGISWSKYMDQWWKEMRKLAADRIPPDEEPWINRQRIATARDSYGWRSIVSTGRRDK